MARVRGKWYVLVAAALTCLVGGTVSAWGEELRVAGGAGPVKNVLQPVKEAFEKSSGMKLVITELGGTNAFKELMKGANLDMASAGYSFDELILELKKENIEVDRTAYKTVVVSRANIHVLINKSNPVSKLSKEQLSGIFTGKIQSWKDVGGNDAPLLVTIAKLNPATNTTFRNQVMGGADYAKDIAETTTTDDLKQFIASNPEAIGFGPASVIGGEIKGVEAPEIARDITFITKGEPSPKVKKLLDFVMGEGQKYIKK